MVAGFLLYASYRVKTLNDGIRGALYIVISLILNNALFGLIGIIFLFSLKWLYMKQQIYK